VLLGRSTQKSIAIGVGVYRDRCGPNQENTPNQGRASKTSGRAIEKEQKAVRGDPPKRFAGIISNAQLFFYHGSTRWGEKIGFEKSGRARCCLRIGKNNFALSVAWGLVCASAMGDMVTFEAAPAGKGGEEGGEVNKAEGATQRQMHTGIGAPIPPL